MNTHIKTWLGTTIIIIMAITAGMFVWKVYEMNNVSVSAPQTTQIPKKGEAVCASEAKICPDGSYVSRTGPNCEFAPCPEEQNKIANPASVYCEKNGGKITTQLNQSNQKEEIGFCNFNDGSQCEEWKYFRGECKYGDNPTIKGKIINSDNSNWKKYQNKSYNFEFSFPKDWWIEPTGHLEDLGEKDFIVFNSGLMLNESVFVSVLVSDTSTYSIDELKKVTGGIITDVKEKKIALNGNPAIEISYTAVADAQLGASQMKKIVVLKNNLVYLIECNKINCEKILSTFKFTN